MSKCKHGDVKIKVLNPSNAKKQVKAGLMQEQPC